MLPGAIGYIDLSSFADLGLGIANDPARDAADAALQLIIEANAVIIDLRDNIGGSLDMVGYLVSAFTPKDANIYDVTQRRDGTESERPKLPYRTPRPDVPLYVLISARTASSAEALAYTLQAPRRAFIVGEVSAGAANPGGTFPVSDGFAVFVSTGKAINPITGTNWEGGGVKPDYAIAAQEAPHYAQRLALEAILAKNPNGPDSVYCHLVLEALRAEDIHPSGGPLTDYVGTYNDAIITAKEDGLRLSQGRRLPLMLLRLEGDVFFDRGEPSRRVIFERTSVGKVRGFELIYSNGHSVWFPGRTMRAGHY
jgi:C-terminal processing protease CtpA/Prc